LLAVIAIGVVWLWVSVTGDPAPNESISTVSGLPNAARGSRLDPSLVPPPTSLPVPPPTNTPETARATPPHASRETAGLPAEDLELRDALWVEGRVVVPPGTPADELVEVVADGGPFETRPLHRSPIAADGSFRVAFAHDTVLGTLDLVARYLYVDQTMTVSPAQPPRDIRITPRLGGRIHGQVILSPAALSLRAAIVGGSAEARRASRASVRIGKIDERLEFDLAGVPSGSDYEIRILAPGFSPTPLRGVHVERGETSFIDIEPSLAAPVSGLVFDADGTAANVTQVVARSPGVDDSGFPRFCETTEVVSDASGRFAFPGLTPGEWDLIATARGSAESLPYRVRLDAGRSVEGVRLTLRRAGRITGRVFGSDGQPAVFAGVSVRSDATSSRVSDSSGWVLGDTARTTDSHGDFEFDSLSPGSYRIEVGWSDPARGGEASRSGIALAEGGCVENIVIRIERPGRIEGRVIGPDERPASDVFVSATEAETRISRSNVAKTDESGRFLLERVPPGDILLVVQGQNLAQVGETRIALRPGEVVQTELAVRAATRLDVLLEGFGEDPGAVTVSVLDEKRMPVSIALPRRPSSSMGLPTSVLFCTIGPILPGKYVVEAVAAEKRASQTVTLSGQATESVRLSAGP